MASIGYNAKIEFSTTEGGTYAALVSSPTKIMIPSLDVSRVETTHLQSPGRTKEYVAGLFDPAAVPVESRYVKSDYLALKAIEGSVRWFKISSNDGTPLTAIFPGYVHKIETDFEAEVVSPMNFEIQTTGEVTVA